MLLWCLWGVRGVGFQLLPATVLAFFMLVHRSLRSFWLLLLVQVKYVFYIQLKYSFYLTLKTGIICSCIYQQYEDYSALRQHELLFYLLVKCLYEQMVITKSDNENWSILSCDKGGCILDTFHCWFQVFHLPIWGNEFWRRAGAAGPPRKDLPLLGSQRLGDGWWSTTQLCWTR